MISQPKLIHKRDPFYVDPPPKAHYYPTEKKQLSESQKKTNISPSRPTCRKPYEEERLSYNDELFLNGGNAFTSKLIQDKDETCSSKFDESWPSTERPLSFTDEDHPLNDIIFQRKGDRFAELKKTLEFPEKDVPDNKPSLISQNGNMRQESSTTLQKYIDRFRTGQPMSREERNKKTSSSSQKDFWWLSDRSFTDSSTPKDDSPGAKRSRRFTPHSPVTPYSSHGDKKSTHQSFNPHTLDDTTKMLQEKADRLLDSASSVASSDPIVSTEGLGSSQSFSTTISSVEEQAYRPSFAKKLDKQVKHSYQIPRPQGKQPSGPEDDVLYQWRLRRRMEQARDTAAKTPAVKFGYKDKSHEQREIDQKLEEFKHKLSGKGVQQSITVDTNDFNSGSLTESYVPLSHASVQFTPAPQVKGHQQQFHERSATRQNIPIASPMLPQGADQIEPHFHLTCDLLQCSHQGYKSEHKHQTDKNKVKTDKNVGNQSKSSENAVRGDNSKIFDKNSSVCHDDSSEEDRYKFLKAERPDVEAKDKDNNTEESDKEDMNNFPRSVSTHSKTTDNEIKPKRQSQHDKIQNRNRSDVEVNKIKDSNIPELKRSGKPSVSKPAMDSAIGQVVKDRLFNVSTSTVLSSIDSEISSPPRLPKFTGNQQQKTANDKTIDESVESDGEYPDDQLLHMLRKQRTQYEEQLRQIDEMLSRFDTEDG